MVDQQGAGEGHPGSVLAAPPYKLRRGHLDLACYANPHDVERAFEEIAVTMTGNAELENHGARLHISFKKITRGAMRESRETRSHAGKHLR
jgi:hypothetical protein